MTGRDPFADRRVVLNDLERDLLQRWVDDVAPRLGLDGWRIRVSPHEAMDGSFASTHIQDAADEATVAVCEDWRHLEPTSLRHSLTHELLHPHVHRITYLAEKLLEAELGRRTESVIREAVSIEEERAIDRLAYGVAQLLPFVDVPPERGAD